MLAMYVDLAALGLILIYGFLGYRYGLTGALINLAGMIGGYIAAVLYAREAAVMLASRTGMAPLFALPVASLLIFLLVTRSFYLLHLLVRKLLEGDTSGPSPLLTVDRMGGLAFGLLKGAAIVGFVLWGLPTLLGQSDMASQVGLSESNLASLVRTTIETAGRYGFSFLTDDPNAQAVLARAVAEPRATLQETATLVVNPRLKACLADPFVQQQARTLGLVGVVKSGQFDAVLADDAFQKGLKTIGFQPQNGRSVTREEIGRAVVNLNSQLQKKAAQMQSAEGWQEFQAFLADPQVQEQLRRGEVTALVNDPRLARALGMAPAPVTARGPETAPHPPVQASGF